MQKTDNFGPLEIKYSKTDHPIPVIDGIHIHSAYNPIKEAEGFVQKNINEVEKKNRLLVLGFGFGYHLNVIENIMKNKFGDNYEVVVLEPNKEVYDHYKELRPIQLKNNIHIICQDEVIELYRNRGLVEFLSNKPTVLIHPASFNLYSTFFRTFLSFKFPVAVEQNANLIKNSEIREYITREYENQLIDQVLEINSNKTNLNRVDLFLSAFNELVSQEKNQLGQGHE
jgi:hypothetical protein